MKIFLRKNFTTKKFQIYIRYVSSLIHLCTHMYIQTDISQKYIRLIQIIRTASSLHHNYGLFLRTHMKHAIITSVLTCTVNQLSRGHDTIYQYQFLSLPKEASEKDMGMFKHSDITFI